MVHMWREAVARMRRVRAGTRAPALFLGSPVLQSLVSHLEGRLDAGRLG